MISSVRRTLAVAPLALLSLGVLAACGGENTKTDCSLNACTVTFDRGVNASANILGAKVELVKVQGETVTLKIGGEQVTIPVGDGQTEADGGFDVDVTSVTKDNVVVKISHNG